VSEGDQFVGERGAVEGGDAGRGAVQRSGNSVREAFVPSDEGTDRSPEKWGPNAASDALASGAGTSSGDATSKGFLSPKGSSNALEDEAVRCCAILVWYCAVVTCGSRGARVGRCGSQRSRWPGAGCGAAAAMD